MTGEEAYGDGDLPRVPAPKKAHALHYRPISSGDPGTAARRALPLIQRSITELRSVGVAIAKCRWFLNRLRRATPGTKQAPADQIGTTRDRALRCLVVAMVLLLGSLESQAARRAWVVGVSDYANVPALRNARADAELMARTLQELGFSVQLSLDPTLKHLQADLRRFRLSVQEDDELLFYFAGHGVQIGGSNYLLPSDITADHEYQIKDDAPALSRILRDLRAKRPRLVLGIIDACRDNPFAGSSRSLGGSGLTGVSGATGQIVIYAAGEGQRALDRLGPQDTSPHGLFTRVMVQEMRQPGVPLREILFRVRQEVAKQAATIRHEQVPAIYDQALGNFVFAPAPLQVQATQEPIPQPPARDRRPGPNAVACLLCPAMVPVPGGVLVMGSPRNEPGRNSNEGMQRRVELAPFEISATEVTQGLWHAVMGSNPSRFQQCGSECPVERVSWDDVQAFLAALKRQTGLRFRLPSEAQWEYAARARSTGRWGFGDDESLLIEYGWTSAASARQPREVGTLRPNALGVFDMHGNVAEWVQDCYSSEASRLDQRHDGSALEQTPCERRSVRGGSWQDDTGRTRSAARWGLPSDHRSSAVGFRLVRVPE